MATSLAPEAIQTLTQIQHILQRPDMYIGTCQRVQRESFCLTTVDNKPKIRNCTIQHSEGMEQLYLEVIGNAADNIWRSLEEFNPPIDPVRIEVTMTQIHVTVKNYGANIAVAQDEQGHWIPHKIFSYFMTGSNFDDTKKRTYIGKNGLGGKLTNVYSTSFSVECADPARGLLYKETWVNNMSSSQFSLEPYSGIGYTQVSYSPDFARFQMESFDIESVQLYVARAIEVAYTCKYPVIFNGVEYKMNTIFDYANMFFTVNKSNAISYADPNAGYEICLVDTPNEAVCVSFVNGIITRLGGVHVDEAHKIVVAKIISILDKHTEGVSITKRDIMPHVSVFLNCRLNQPGFKNQAKEYLTRPTPKIDIPDELMKNVKKWDVIKHIYAAIEAKQKAKLKKTDGRRTRVYNERITDANLAGTNRGQEATAVLCEGNSAEQYVIAWISQFPNGMGRDYFGSLPLHGKLLNVLTADFTQLLENADINNIKQMMGFEEDCNYLHEQVLRRLRYGRILLATDSDTDGKHIVALVLLFLITRFPGFVYNRRVSFLRTPIIRAAGKGYKWSFYTYTAYYEWCAAIKSTGQNPNDFEHNYYKGLGSSEKKDIKEDFANMKAVNLILDEEAGKNAILAFHDKHANERKKWLSDWINRLITENLENVTEMTVSTFINQELIQYSLESIERCIPDGIDGLKESQRKIMFATNRKLARAKKDEKIKVSTLASHTSEITEYKHGENSLVETIAMMTQDFVGANNMPYIVARAMLGSRNQGGKDFSAARYTYVSIQWWLNYIYRKEDIGILKRIVDEGHEKEYENYLPILPMHVINGQEGIGTGWSTKIPNHNPLDVCLWLQQRIMQDLEPDAGHQLPLLRPWYKGFTGQITPSKNGFQSEGRFTFIDQTHILIDELPIGVWNKKYEDKLKEWEKEGVIESYKAYSTDEVPRFIINKFIGIKKEDGSRQSSVDLKVLGLISRLSYGNMTVIFRGERGYYPKTYNSLESLLQDFYTIRLGKYNDRITHLMRALEEEVKTLKERYRFIATVNEGHIVITKRKKADVLADLTKYNFNHTLYTSVKTNEYSDEALAEIVNNINLKSQEYQNLRTMHPGRTWYAELEEFVVAWCRHENVQRSTFESCNPPMTIVLKTSLLT